MRVGDLTSDLWPLLQLLDLCMMDVDWLGYSYSVLAAAAFCHFSTFEVVHKVSGESDLRSSSSRLTCGRS